VRHCVLLEQPIISKHEHPPVWIFEGCTARVCDNVTWITVANIVYRASHRRSVSGC
jgi:hypothetical protein